MKLKPGDKILVVWDGGRLLRGTVRVVGRHHNKAAATCYRSYDKTADNFIVFQHTEGVSWCWGHDRKSPEANALLVAVALR